MHHQLPTTFIVIIIKTQYISRLNKVHKKLIHKLNYFNSLKYNNIIKKQKIDLLVKLL